MLYTNHVTFTVTLDLYIYCANYNIPFRSSDLLVVAESACWPYAGVSGAFPKLVLDLLNSKSHTVPRIRLELKITVVIIMN